MGSRRPGPQPLLWAPVFSSKMVSRKCHAAGMGEFHTVCKLEIEASADSLAKCPSQTHSTWTVRVGDTGKWGVTRVVGFRVQMWVFWTWLRDYTRWRRGAEEGYGWWGGGGAVKK